jgi:hypothetical protein
LHALTRLGPTEAFQREQTKSLKGLNPGLLIIVEIPPVVLHGAQTHPDPRIQFVEDRSSGEEGSGEEMSCSPNNLVEFGNDFSLEVVLPAGQLPDLIFEFLQ